MTGKNNNQEERRTRTLTDEDVEAIVDNLRKKFFINLGKGVWALAWKGIILLAVGIAIYGATHHFWSK